MPTRGYVCSAQRSFTWRHWGAVKVSRRVVAATRAIRKVLARCNARSPPGLRIAVRRAHPPSGTPRSDAGIPDAPEASRSSPLTANRSAVRPEDWDMLDILFIAATVAFFAVSLAYVRGCDRL